MFMPVSSWFSYLLFYSTKTDASESPRVAGLDRFGRKTPKPEMGLMLLGELNCLACHAAGATQAVWVNAKRGSELSRVSERARPEWVRKFLASPHTIGVGATMPDLLHRLPVNERDAVATDIVHYLYTNAAKEAPTPNFKPENLASGEALYHRVGCVACHGAKSTIEVDKENLLGLVLLPVLREKWTWDGLKRFLQDPLATRPSGRMPSLKLSGGEESDIAHYLLNGKIEPAAEFVWDQERARKGKEAFERLRCAACHTKVTASSLKMRKELGELQSE